MGSIPGALLLLLLLLSRFSCVRLCTTPETAAHQAPPSLGFSRQEHWKLGSPALQVDSLLPEPPGKPKNTMLRGSQAPRRAVCGTRGSLRTMHGGGSAPSCCAFTPGSPEGNTEGPGTASSEPLLPS